MANLTDKITGAATTPDADNVTYTPADVSDWTGSVDPGEANDAFDQLAQRETDHAAAASAHGATGDMIGLGDNPQFTSTGSIKVPTGTEAQRPAGAAGDIRFNSDETSFEGYDGSEWAGIGGGGLEVSFVTGPTFTAEPGFHYYCSDAVTGIQMPQIEGNEQIAISPARGSLWSASGIVVTPFAGEQLDGTVADETLVLNLTGVDKVTFTGDLANTNWEFNTPVTPTTIGNGAYVGAVETFTPTYGSYSGTIHAASNVGTIQRVGDSVHITLHTMFSAAGAGGQESFDLPTYGGQAITPVAGSYSLGTGPNAGSEEWAVYTIATSSSAMPLYRQNGSTIQGSHMGNSANIVEFNFSAVIPVAEFANSGTTLGVSDFSAKTKVVDDTVLDIVSASSGLAQPPSSVGNFSAVAYRDSNNEYFLWFSGIIIDNTSSAGHNFTFAGVTFEYTSNPSQAFAIGSSGAAPVNGYVSGANELTAFLESSGTWDGAVSGTLKLASKPDWFDDNAENNFNLDVHFQEATATELGLVKIADSEFYTQGGAVVGTDSSNVIVHWPNAADINTGSGITYGSSASAGDTFTITEAGVYAITLAVGISGGDNFIGLSLNNSNVTTALNSLTDSTVLGRVQTPGSNKAAYVPVTTILAVGDVVRCHMQSASTLVTTVAGGNFRITQVMKH
jgi:hypothetical protein